MKKNLCTLLISTVCFTSVFSSERSEKVKNTLKNIDAKVEAWLEDFNVPGAAIAVIADNQVVLAKGFGLRNLESIQPVTTKTLFQVGSLTKSFTGFLMGQLVDEGLFDWNDRVADHIPYFKLKDPYRTYETTIRDYLTHSSGYPCHDGIWYNTVIPRPEMIKRLRYLDPQIGLREGFIYQNIGYMVAAHVAEIETQKSWEDLVKQYIFNPLGMKQSVFTVAEMRKNPDHSNGHREQDKEIRSINIVDAYSIGPAASIISNIEDLIPWAKALLKKGNGLIKESTFEEITSPQVVSNLITRRGMGIEKYCPMEAYGIGWFITSYCNKQLVFHSGNLEGFSSSLLLVPEENISIIVLTNKHLTPLPYIASIMLLQEMVEMPKVDWPAKYKQVSDFSKDTFLKEQEALGVQRHEKTEPSHPIHDFLGTYFHPGYGKLEIAMNRNHLEVCYNKMNLPLNHWHYDVFEVTKEGNVPVLEGLKFTFSENVHGDIDSVSVLFEPKVDEILFKKLKSKKFFSNDYLNRFAGDYSYHGFIFSIIRDGEKLTVKAMGQPPFDLIPERDAMFTVKGFDGYTVQFLSDEKGQINAVQLVQPNNSVFTAHRH